MQLTSSDIRDFHDEVWEAYGKLHRDLPWRVAEADGTFVPYKILVSEIMLQQTQVSRVVPKYQTFLQTFPTARILADSPLGEVLRQWSGLGYNRRAKYLCDSAKVIAQTHSPLPDKMFWQSLPGVGVNTAGAIMVYAYNQPEVFIETNIRTVFLHHFFEDAEHVTDKSISDYVAATLDKSNPREWYWALMDYGNFLKQQRLNHLQQSTQYRKQPPFAGSLRYLRGQVLRQLGSSDQTFESLELTLNDDRLPTVLEALTREGLIKKTDTNYSL